MIIVIVVITITTILQTILSINSSVIMYEVAGVFGSRREDRWMDLRAGRSVPRSANTKSNAELGKVPEHPLEDRIRVLEDF